MLRKKLMLCKHESMLRKHVYLFKINYNKILFTCKQASSTLHSNVNKPYKFTYSKPNLEVHNGELTSLRGMGSLLKAMI